MSMPYLTESSTRVTWHPAMTTADTTAGSYWFNWRVLLCVVWVFLTVAFSSFLIWKYEGLWSSIRRRRGEIEETEEEREQEKREPGSLYEDETWKPCLKGVHPAWLLGFRVVAFFVLLVMLVVTALIDGASIFYYYTQWTFTLITIYFGLGSLLSLNGCYQYQKQVNGDNKVDNVEADAEQGSYVARPYGSNPALPSKFTTNSSSHHHDDQSLSLLRRPAGPWAYAFQIIFQMNAGAVLLTDCVFWFIIVPFLEINNYNLNVLVINMHSINAVFLLGDAALNCLRFPLFRMSYFFLWTVTYVVFQWIVHASVKLWWPYPFLDLSSSYAPLWYLAVAMMHIPCYGVFALAMKLKQYLLPRWFPESYQCLR